jgi:hypothetical protein
MLQALVRRFIGRIIQKGRIVLDDADGEAERVIELRHPLGIAFGQVIVDGDQVGAFAF